MSTTRVDSDAVSAALLLSVTSVVWTVLSSTLSIGIGARRHVAVLIAFGAIGVVDAIGSVALSYHFHHARRHDHLDEQLEAIAHRIVLVGLVVVGVSAIGAGVLRLHSSQTADAGTAAIVLTAASMLVLSILALGKERVGRRLGSEALRSDGRVSGIGAVLAAVTLVGTATARWFGWTWVDGSATIVVGAGALALATLSWRDSVR
jgi:divalent metal cation (Fe/Co/Zn/Cd) transporter